MSIEINNCINIKYLTIIQVFNSVEFNDLYMALHIIIAITIILITQIYNLFIMILYFRLKSLLKQQRKFLNGLQY